MFSYMGMVLFTGKLQVWQPAFIGLGILACWLGRALHIFPLRYDS